MKNNIYPLIIFIMLLVSSCNFDEECRKERYVKMEVGFFTKIPGASNTYTISALIIDSLTSKGVGVDSVLYENVKKVSKIQLPLKKFSGESKFLIKFNQKTDTITILHTNTEEFLSLECGCIKVHSIDTVITTNHFISSVKIKSRNVNTTHAEHIQIFN